MPAYGPFMMVRFCAAIGIGGCMPAAASYLCEITPLSSRARYVNEIQHHLCMAVKWTKSSLSILLIFFCSLLKLQGDCIFMYIGHIRWYICGCMCNVFDTIDR